MFMRHTLHPKQALAALIVKNRCERKIPACRQDAGATRVLCRLALGGSGGGGGVDGGGDVDGLAVVEAAEVFDGFVDG